MGFNKYSTEKRVTGAIEAVKGDGFDERENLITAGYISSFEMIKLVNELEKAFDIKIQLERIEPETFDSVDDIVTLVEGLI